ncbi:MAG: hypothetical protein WEB59_06195 [Thermoanaerobaculia bacterium]
MRDIDDILHFRQDISPFLVHLTRAANGADAAAVLRVIVSGKTLKAGETLVSTARYGGSTIKMSADDKRKFFGAICFTETPLSEVHCLLEVRYRQVDLEPYGIVFLKEKLQNKGVSPVLYLNNERGDQDGVARAVFDLKDSSPDAAAMLLPLVSVFGLKLQPPAASAAQAGRVDWLWEREWRYPVVNGELSFDATDVFVGLCPHDRIDGFEGLWPGVGFIDPMRSMKWYATKLIQARQRLGLKYSVV